MNVLNIAPVNLTDTEWAQIALVKERRKPSTVCRFDKGEHEWVHVTVQMGVAIISSVECGKCSPVLRVRQAWMDYFDAGGDQC